MRILNIIKSKSGDKVISMKILNISKAKMETKSFRITDCLDYFGCERIGKARTEANRRSFFNRFLLS